ncbi:MAG: Isoprenyl transferase [Parcubacteria group bacterium GW2011_GWC2_45_7]|nr:MAG: Isoprenyl transferase [Parcubacteria group bacterium GW2011_GWC2_45_7]
MKPETITSESSTNIEGWLLKVSESWANIPGFQVNIDKLKHLAIICDGNRRAAEQRGLNPWSGHRVGVEVIKGIMEANREWGIKHLTLWTWSTENWKRDEAQVSFVMNLAARYLRDDQAVAKLAEHRVKFTHLGRKDRIPEEVRQSIDELERKTSGFNDLYVNLALDYGGLDEAGRAIGKMVEWIREGKLAESEILINPGVVLGFLDTAGQPAPDLVVRTGMPEEEIPRTSGFMPLQTAYSGWKFIPELFPDLTPGVLLTCVKDFLGYERRLGK